MNRDQYILLFEKFLAGNATDEEVDIIMSYRDKFEITELQPNDKQEDYQDIENRLLKKLKLNINTKATHTSFSKWWMVAACVFVFAMGGLFYRSYQKEVPRKLYVTSVAKVNPIKPGSNKALLTLANGNKIVLNDASTGTIIKQGNIIVRKEKDGVLQYAKASDKNTDPDKKALIGYNTIATPKGGQYQVILPDGTRVWLNSASTLKYPTAFVGNERKVELTGEGYFEVAQDKSKPFKVKFNNEEVEDLGTHFNIMAYNDEGETRTTLLEGSVKVSKGTFYKVLVPGQQTISQNNQDNFVVRPADIESAVAWKNGIFSLQNSSIQQIMRQVARWYDVDIIYQGNLKDKVYGGRVSKANNINELLKNLELTGTVHFKIEGRRITVME
jgi:transmembrane sensor